ncbi:myotubularin-related protein 12-like protein [Dinothrombium tinctorium]|uniref:Myotubularin-related protein 12-like protein n=1 Tax=Dinothrombium tinctorium TaxID=1965070 RepID=A0A443QJF3_9ACAR|nr:myotubularin-related protein 12-like protein [Dinothrombium tinctorium]
MMSRFSLNWGSNKANKSSFKSYINEASEDGLRNTGEHSVSPVSGRSSPHSKHSLENDSDEIWTTLSALDDSVDNLPEINISLCESNSHESLDNIVDTEKSFIALRKFGMSPVRNRDSYQVTKDSLEMGRLSISSNKSIPFLSSTVAFPLRPNELIVMQPFDGVIRYHLNSNRTKGTVGQLSLTCVRLKFVTYPQSDFRNDKNESVPSLPPFTHHTSSEEKVELFDEDIDLINVYSFQTEYVQSGSSILLTVYCNDFRCIEYQIRNNENVRCLLENLEKMTIEPSLSSSSSNLATLNQPRRVYEVPSLWYQLSTEYSFTFPQNWMKAENHWLTGKTSLRVTHCNDGLQMCSSLPPSFVTLKYHLTDQVLISMISRTQRSQRVPVVCYARQMIDAVTKKELNGYNMLIRSVTLTDDVISIIRQAVNPLRVMDVNSLLPSLVTLMAAHGKLRDACFLYSSTNHFLCRIGKWIKIVSKVLSVVKDMSKIIQTEASLLIMEDTDRDWNPLISSLIQIVVDPYRRTIKGFESLISKEWIHLCGVSNKPNHVLFTLFLDCVWQLKTQNPLEFEFTSLYLIHTFDLLFIPQTAKRISAESEETVQSESTVLANNAKIDTRNKFPLSLKTLNVDQLLFIYNPFYSHESARRLNVRCDILGLDLWRPLYLRWHPLTNYIDYYNQFTPSEFIYFNSLLLSLLKYNVKKIVSNEDKDHTCNL